MSMIEACRNTPPPINKRSLKNTFIPPDDNYYSLIVNDVKQVVFKQRQQRRERSSRRISELTPSFRASFTSLATTSSSQASSFYQTPPSEFAQENAYGSHPSFNNFKHFNKIKWKRNGSQRSTQGSSPLSNDYLRSTNIPLSMIRQRKNKSNRSQSVTIFGNRYPIDQSSNNHSLGRRVLSRSLSYTSLNSYKSEDTHGGEAPSSYLNVEYSPNSHRYLDIKSFETSSSNEGRSPANSLLSSSENTSWLHNRKFKPALSPASSFNEQMMSRQAASMDVPGTSSSSWLHNKSTSQR